MDGFHVSRGRIVGPEVVRSSGRREKRTCARGALGAPHRPHNWLRAANSVAGLQLRAAPAIKQQRTQSKTSKARKQLKADELFDNRRLQAAHNASEWTATRRAGPVASQTEQHCKRATLTTDQLRTRQAEGESLPCKGNSEQNASTIPSLRALKRKERATACWPREANIQQGRGLRTAHRTPV